MTQPTAQQLIAHFKLTPLPDEGGMFRQTYRSAANPPDSEKPFGTAILYLLTSEANSFSALHKLPTDEIYHFYLGHPVELVMLHPDGSVETVTLGQDVLQGQQIQTVVRAGVWQGSYVIQGGDYALLGTTMAPGYTDDDYIGGQRDALLDAYPDAHDLILRLMR